MHFHVRLRWGLSMPEHVGENSPGGCVRQEIGPLSTLARAIIPMAFRSGCYGEYRIWSELI